MKTFQVFEALVNSDMTEGRGPMRHVAYFTRYLDAKASVKGMGVMGMGDGEVKEVLLRIHEGIDEFEQYNKEKLKQSALSKLTWDEKKALGL